MHRMKPVVNYVFLRKYEYRCRLIGNWSGLASLARSLRAVSAARLHHALGRKTQEFSASSLSFAG